jgi:hypothetical protein
MRNRTDRPFVRALARAATPTRARALRLLLCTVVICALAAGPVGAEAPAATLDVVPDGNGTVTVSPAPAGATACAGSPDTLSLDKLGDCAYDVASGQEVTLTATPNAEPPELEPKTAFVGWSDARCPGTGPCTLPIDSDWQSVTALFSPQRVTVKSRGPGTVIIPGGAECGPTATPRLLDCGRLPLLSRVTLQAKPFDPAVGVTWEPLLCDTPAPKKGDVLCTVSVLGPAQAKVGFGDEPGGDVSPTIRVTFRVLKQGSGSGTVRSESLDCGSQCALDAHFGDRETLVAEPASGSTFMGWRGMCSTALRCSLAVGPVTSVVAVFDDASKGGSPASDREPNARPEGSRGSAPFVARLRRIAVTGHGARRRVLMRVQVNGPATVRAALSRRRDRVAGGRWRVRGGMPLLRLRIPAGARSGRYRLALSVRGAVGHATHMTRKVWLPR